MLDIPVDKIKSLDEIESIDKAEEKLDKSMENRGLNKIHIPLEVEFWGHCSNLQVWAENNYNIRLLHRAPAFPLLIELFNLGDPIAKRVFKEEIIQRVKSGHPSVILYLLNHDYLDYFNEEELEAVFNELGSLIIKTLLKSFAISNKFCVGIISRRDIFAIWQKRG